ncbi:MAG TPA: phosphatase PAP2 family protein [Gemmatimonadaceae bacterium]|nr:phosphatase PAP2 family protein [Gemmatimonadaceae bacterium]
MTTSPTHDPLRRPWRSRFAHRHPRAYLAAHVAGGTLAVVVLTWIFLFIADEIPEPSALVGVDRFVSAWMESHGTEPGERILHAVSYLGAPGLFAIVVVVVAWLSWRRDWLAASALVATTASGMFLDSVLKFVFHRGRPETAIEFIRRASWSFPSGHAMNSMIGYGFLTVLLLEHVRDARRRAAIVIAAALLIGVIGFSRLYLGVHYLSDVTGGWLAGGAWLIVCASGYRFARARLTLQGFSGVARTESHTASAGLGR